MADKTAERPLRPDLLKLTKRLIDDALPKLRDHLDGGGFVPRDSDWLKVDHFKSGFPHIVRDFDAKVLEYNRVFASQAGQFATIAVADWPSFKELLAHARADRELRQAFSLFGVDFESLALPGKDEIVELFFQSAVTSFAFGILDRAIHLHGLDFSTEQLEAIYGERERGLLCERVPVLVVVPIALTHFESEEPKIVGPTQAVVPISDDMQLARMPRSHTGVGVEHAVIGAATHAYLQTSWEIPNPDRTAGQMDVDWWYPTQSIDHFFSALRVVTGLETGYAQAFMKPVGWATSWTAHLPPVTRREIVRRFPPAFEKYGWLRERRAVTTEELEEVGKVFAALEEHGGALDLAASRLSAAMLRESERDSILDVVIGLEALLSDGEPTEVTHKLSMRVAAVLGQAAHPRSDPREAFAATKHIYRYRSAVAHGDAKNAAKRERFRTAGREERTLELATTYLRRVIIALRNHPRLWSGDAIDREFVLPGLGAGALVATFAGPVPPRA